MDHLFIHDVTIVRPAADAGRYGDDEDNWATATRTAAKAWIARTATREDHDRRQAQVSDWVGYFAEGTDVVGYDRVEWGAITFEVDGPPNLAWTPRGEHHIEAQLVVVEG